MNGLGRIDKNLIMRLCSSGIKPKTAHKMLLAVDSWFNRGVLNPDVTLDYITRVNRIAYRIIEMDCEGMTEDDMQSFYTMVAYCQREPYKGYRSK